LEERSSPIIPSYLEILNFSIHFEGAQEATDGIRIDSCWKTLMISTALRHKRYEIDSRSSPSTIVLHLLGNYSLIHYNIIFFWLFRRNMHNTTAIRFCRLSWNICLPAGLGINNTNGQCSPCECPVTSTPVVSVDENVQQKGDSGAFVDETLPRENEWRFTFGRDDCDRALDDQDCDASFPGLFEEVNRATQFRGYRVILLEELESIKISNGMVRAMIFDRRVIAPSPGPERH
jgi:hypothetical protein